MSSKNDITKWIIVAITVGGLIFNSGILYNDVKHLRESVNRIEHEMEQLREHILEGKVVVQTDGQTNG